MTLGRVAALDPPREARSSAAERELTGPRLIRLPTGPTGRRAPWQNAVLRALGPFAVLLLWTLATHTGFIRPQMLAPPEEVLRAVYDLVGTGVLFENLQASLVRSFSGLILGVGVGLALGLFTGLNRLGDQLVDPVLQMLRTVPFLAIAPLLVLWFGIGEDQKISMIAVASCFPFYLNTHSGVRGADGKLLEAARVFGLSRAGIIRTIILPAAVPQMLVGLRQSLGISLIALIVVEQTNAQKGIGFLMLSASQFFQSEILLVCVLLYALWGLAADVFVRALERVLMPWRHARSKS